LVYLTMSSRYAPADQRRRLYSIAAGSPIRQAAQMADYSAEPRPAQVRQVSPDDWATYRQVRLTALADAPEAFASTLERERDLGEQLWRRRLGAAASFLAWRDGAPVGAVTALPYDDAQVHGFHGAWHLVAMWVSPAARGLGIGRMLVQTVIDQASAAGAPSVVLWVFDANERARGLYERMGFRPTNRTDTRPGNPEDIEHLMIRELVAS
jgi:ribosomal protein S18 acetylase RimI-like enzyme